MAEMREPITLFERLPADLFKPLGATNRRIYWDVIVRLYEDHFSAEAELPESGYYLKHDLVPPIERYIAHEADWAEEEGITHDTPVNIRANNTLAYLIDCGWFVETRVVLNRTIEMRPDVAQFLQMLLEFTERGPRFIGGKVQVIYGTLKNIVNDPAGQADAFFETAKLVRDLVNGVAATRTQVSELMSSLRDIDEAGTYVEAFFNSYIEQIYIADYSDLRTTNHPLRRRREILDLVLELKINEDKRAQLLSWYRKQKWGRLTPEQALDRDFRRYDIFERIEEHLDRLNRVVATANRQAMSYIQYTMRTRQNFDRAIDRSIEIVSNAAGGHAKPSTLIAAPLAAGIGLSEVTLATPSTPRRPPQRRTLKKREISPRQIALNNLRKAMSNHRRTDPATVSHYLDMALGDDNELSSDELSIETVNNLCVFLTLPRIAALNQVTDQAGHHTGRVASGPTQRVVLPGLKLAIDTDNPIDNTYVRAPRVTIRRTARK